MTDTHKSLYMISNAVQILLFLSTMKSSLMFSNISVYERKTYYFQTIRLCINYGKRIEASSNLYKGRKREGWFILMYAFDLYWCMHFIALLQIGFSELTPILCLICYIHGTLFKSTFCSFKKECKRVINGI